MRLLDFNKDEGGANPQHSRSRPPKRKPLAQVSQSKPVRLPTPPRGATSNPKTRNEAYSIQGTTIRKQYTDNNGDRCSNKFSVY